MSMPRVMADLLSWGHWLGCVLLLSMPFCHAAAADDLAADAALQFMAAVQSADTERINRLEQGVLQEKLDGEALVRLWKQLQVRWGDYRLCEPKETTPQSQHTFVVLSCRFDKGAADVQLTLAKGLVAGIFIGAFHADAPAPASNIGFRESELRFGQEGWELPATLTLPSRDEDIVGAAVLVHGSGPLDRNATVGETQLFRDLAVKLARAGIATLRYEKRTLHYAVRLARQPDVTLDEETAVDAGMALDLLASHTAPSFHCTFLVGHSLGAYLAPHIANNRSRLTGLVLLAPPGRRMVDVMLDQVDYLLTKPGGASGAEAPLRRQRDKLLAFRRDGLASSEGPGIWGRSAWSFFQTYDPLSAWLQHPVPTQAVFAEKDYQVNAADQRAWQGLADRFPGLVDVALMPGVGHVFTPVTGRPSPQSYLVKAEASDAMVERVVGFMRRRCPAAGHPNTEVASDRR